MATHQAHEVRSSMSALANGQAIGFSIAMPPPLAKTAAQGSPAPDAKANQDQLRTLREIQDENLRLKSDDYTKGPIATSSVLAGSSMTTTTPRTAPDGVRIGLAAELGGDDALSFRAEYEGEMRAQYQSHTGVVKALWGF